MDYQQNNYNNYMHKLPDNGSRFMGEMHRNDESHSININRRIMERDFMFNMDTQNDNQNNNAATDNFNIGEITGLHFNQSEIDQGMPMRGFIDNRRDYIPSVEQQQEQSYYNPKLDFDLYESEPQINVSYYDPTVNESNFQMDFSGVNDNQFIPPTKRIDPEKTFSTTINFLSCDILNKFNKLLNNKTIFTLSPLSLLAPLILLYRGSHGGTELEFKKYLSLPDKNTSFKSLSRLCQKMLMSQNVTASSLVFIPSSFPLNRAFINYVNDIGTIIPIDLSKPQQEINKINNTIRNYTGGIIKKIVDRNFINMNTNIVLISTIYFRGKWKNPFLRNQDFFEPFYSGNSADGMPRQVMKFNSSIFNYYQDNLNQIVEMDYDDNEYTMGIILPTSYSDEPSISHDQLEYYISQLTPTQINNLQIPKFKRQSKFRIDNLFKKIGLREIFTNADFSEITPSNNILYVSDIIHQAIIIVGENGSYSNRASHDSSKSRIDFIANHPFIYYIRYIPTNTILMIGQYN